MCKILLFSLEIKNNQIHPCMKKFYSFFFILYFTIFILTSSIAQVGEWVWLHGSDTPNVSQIYGTQGVSNATNVPPCIYEAC